MHNRQMVVLIICLQLTRMDKNNSKYIKRDSAMLVVVQNIGVKGIIPTSDNIMGRRRENVM